MKDDPLAEALVVSISPADVEEGSRRNRLCILFENTHPSDSIQILKPLDGSTHGWLMPHYAITVTHANGNDLALGGRFGNFGSPWSGMTWPEDYVIELAPGETHAQKEDFPHAVVESEEYEVSFRYVFTPAEDDTFDGGPYPEGLWHGSAEAKAIQMELREP